METPFKSFTQAEYDNFLAGLRGKIEAEYDAKLGEQHKAYMDELAGAFKALGIEVPNKGNKLNALVNYTSELQKTAAKLPEFEGKIKEYETKIKDISFDSEISVTFAKYSDKFANDYMKKAVFGSAKRDVIERFEKGEINPKTNKPYTISELTDEIVGSVLPKEEPKPTTGTPTKPQLKDVGTSLSKEEIAKLAVEKKLAIGSPEHLKMLQENGHLK
jgi:hypothetical protein